MQGQHEHLCISNLCLCWSVISPSMDQHSRMQCRSLCRRAVLHFTLQSFCGRNKGHHSSILFAGAVRMRHSCLARADAKGCSAHACDYRRCCFHAVGQRKPQGGCSASARLRKRMAKPLRSCWTNSVSPQRQAKLSNRQ